MTFSPQNVSVFSDSQEVISQPLLHERHPQPHPTSSLHGSLGEGKQRGREERRGEGEGGRKERREEREVQMVNFPTISNPREL